MKVCKRWQRFENFYADMGDPPSATHSLDRYPNNKGDYEPGNVRWATPKEQQNNRRNNHMLTFNGTTLTLSQWADKTGISAPVLEARFRVLHWSVDKSLSTPVRKRV